MWDVSFRKIAEGNERRATGENGTKSIVGVASEEMLERFAGITIIVEGIEKA